MKVTQIGGFTVSNAMKVSSIKRNALDFTTRSTRDNELVAICPILLPNSGEDSDTRKFIATCALKVRSQAETSSKGKLRYLVETSLPYTAISPDVADNAIVANQFDSKRSGANMTLHAVLELPKAAVDDLKGAYGSTCQRGASAQVAILQMLFGAMLQAAGQPGDSLVQSWGDTTTTSRLPNGKLAVDLDLSDDAKANRMPLVDEKAQTTTTTPTIRELEEYPGVAGIDASNCTDLAGGLASGVMRAVNGVRTLDVTGEYPTPQVVLPNYESGT